MPPSAATAPARGTHGDVTRSVEAASAARRSGKLNVVCRQQTCTSAATDGARWHALWQGAAVLHCTYVIGHKAEDGIAAVCIAWADSCGAFQRTQVVQLQSSHSGNALHAAAAEVHWEAAKQVLAASMSLMAQCDADAAHQMTHLYVALPCDQRDSFWPWLQMPWLLRDARRGGLRLPGRHFDVTLALVAVDASPAAYQVRPCRLVADGVWASINIFLTCRWSYLWGRCLVLTCRIVATSGRLNDRDLTLLLAHCKREPMDERLRCCRFRSTSVPLTKVLSLLRQRCGQSRSGRLRLAACAKCGTLQLRAAAPVVPTLPGVVQQQLRGATRHHKRCPALMQPRALPAGTCLSAGRVSLERPAPQPLRLWDSGIAAAVLLRALSPLQLTSGALQSGPARYRHTEQHPVLHVPPTIYACKPRVAAPLSLRCSSAGDQQAPLRRAHRW